MKEPDIGTVTEHERARQRVLDLVRQIAREVVHRVVAAADNTTSDAGSPNINQPPKERNRER